MTPDNPLLLTIVMTILLPLCAVAGYRIRHLMRQHENDDLTARDFEQQIIAGASTEALLEVYRQTLTHALHPETCFIFRGPDQQGQYWADQTDLRFAGDGALTDQLKQQLEPLVLRHRRLWTRWLGPDAERLNILRARIILSMHSADGLIGFVLIGPSQSGTAYSQEQVRFASRITQQLTQAAEHSRITTLLEQRVSELSMLTQISQAVNFVASIDNLLEIIHTQTQRLINTDCFYIALQDTSTQQAYFMFCEEKGERLHEQENIRWALGRDPFSEVIRQSQPLIMHGDEGAKMQISPAGLELSSDLQVWAGIPMITGARLLGLIAAGRTQPGTPFNSEQITLMNDIAAIAASSLDKARLYHDAQMRERQLMALNEISRQLVATESDVEQLLALITSSAVDILNAEAGSLLLNADDGSDDLVFRVVIGGAGAALMGSRVASGQGVVGEVAQTGSALIVNDATQDPRHHDLSPGFVTRALLAVPLVVQDRVIGVLELLNKRDGTPFLADDEALLTTFAGQAAIAIENARLFQMTDIQLARRVNELETLERIDQALNQTLDVGRVAQITVSAAIATLHADAAALGLVAGAPPHLEIIALEGYDDDDFPDGADGLHWPLDRGIVGRVMRNQQPDLVADTRIDPDYLPSLRGSISQITIPLLAGRELRAVLLLEKKTQPPFTLPDWGFAQRLSDHASIAITNALLYDEVARANDNKSDFVSFAAHELKNPLSAIKGYADVMLAGMSGDISDQQRGFLQIVVDNAGRMQRIIEDLRDSAKADTSEGITVTLAPCHVAAVMQESIQPFRKQIEDKAQSLVLNLAEGLPLVMGDHSRLVQIMTNLISNAHKYSPTGGTITITADSQPDYRDASQRRLGPVVHISVADEGVGMSQDDLSKIFHERYFRSENPLVREQAGTGLGLMITQSLVRAHGGDIWAESSLNQGSVFHVVLPTAPDQPL